MNLKQKVAKLQDHEYKASANDQEIQIRLKRLKDLECESEQLRKSNLRLQMDNSDLARRLDSTQILANAVLEDPESLDPEELVYLRWINACLRHELRSLSISTGNDAGTEGPRSEYATPSATSRTSFDFNRTMSLKEESGRNSDSHTPGSSKNFSARRRRSVDFKNCLDSFSESSGTEKSNLVKYAEAIKDSSGTLKHRTHRRSASYSSF
ncbi:Protein CHUP1, chloroplastic [Glycine soja]|nr:Protein CHUP1, chloroplastic [Glycine soja]